MSTAGSSSTLTQASRQLVQAWQQTKSHWRDVKAQELEEKYIEPLPGQVDRVAKVMAEIDLIMKKVRSDCE